jgi:RNA polymerase sigma factor (sigma-70 family)
MEDSSKSVAEIFGDIESSLSRFLLRFLDRPEDVQDVMQEAYFRVHKASQTSRIRAPAAFIYKTAKNLALNERARHHNSRTSTVADPDELSAGVGENLPELTAIVGEQLSKALSALERMTPRVRETYILRKVHGLSQKETAKHLGISQSTVEKHVAKGLLILAQDTDHD